MATVDPPSTPEISAEALPIHSRKLRVPKTFVALRHRNFRLFIGGQLVSLAGTWMQIIAQGWLVYQISGSELALGIVGFASAVPALIITPWAGVVVDRVARRNLLVITQTCAMLLAFVLSALTFLDVVQVWHVVLVATCLGVVNAFDAPARQAFVVEMVGRDDMPNAIALNSMTFNSGRIIGPALGGLVLVAVGAAWCFFLNGLTFVAVIIALLSMRLPPRIPHESHQSPWQQLRSGLGYVAYHPEVRALLLLALVFGLFGMSYSTVLPAFVDRVLRQGAGAFGAINTASGVGAVTAALLIARYGDRGGRGRWLSRAILLFPAVLMVFSVNTFYPLSLLLAVGLGVGFMNTFTLLNTLIQTLIVDEMRGRVLSLYSLTFFGIGPFGNLLMGSLAERFGLSQTMIGSASLCFLSAALILYLTPSVRRLA
jgi:MFS family permease